MDSQLIISQRKQRNSYGSKIELLSPAKINLYLNILGKYPGGYHRIESLVERISLFDKISIERKSSPTINIASNYKQLESKENLSYRAAKLMQREFDISSGFNIYLEKNIPLGSGLGGASSNAASTILGIKKLLSLTISQEKLYNIGKKLGSDVNFFLSGKSFAYLSGRGQKVEPLLGMRKLNHFIIWPEISLSTKQVYKRFKSNLSTLPCPQAGGRQELTRFFSSVNILKYSLKNTDYFLLKKSVYNCLEKSAFSLYGKLAKIKEAFSAKGICSVMSGSGSAFYTVGLKDHKELKKAVPEKWVICQAKTF